MRYYLDTEFIDDPIARTIDLISIGIVAEDGRELYLVNSEFDLLRCNDWLRANVLPHLGAGYIVPNAGAAAIRAKAATSRTDIRDLIERFVGDDDDVRFWAYFGMCDWLCVMQLWGWFKMPPNLPKFCFDLKQWARQLGIRGSLSDKVPPIGTVHRAIDDAHWNRAAWEYLAQLATTQSPEADV
jgi:hypothetical protein